MSHVHADPSERPGSPKEPVRCPRCGYDQRGVIERWRDSCDLRGTCTECGLNIEFAELLSQKIRRPRWCIEFASSSAALPWRWLKTFGMTFWPWGFWTQLKMSHEIHWRQICAYVAGMVLLIYLAFAIRHGFVAIQTWRNYNAGISANVQITSNQWTQSSTFKCVTTVPWWKAAAQAVLVPWSKESPGPLMPDAPTMAAFAANYSAPMQVTVLQTHPSPASLMFYSEALQQSSWLFVYMLIVAVLAPVGFLAVPISRQQAKVRWAHIARIAVYSAGFAAMAAVLLVWWAPHRSSGFATIWVFSNRECIASQVVVPVMFAIWWSVAVDRYLKMPHAWGVGISVVLIAWLIALLVDAARSGYLYW